MRALQMSTADTQCNTQCRQALQKSNEESTAAGHRLELARRDAVIRAGAAETELERDKQAHAADSDRIDTKQQLTVQRLEAALSELQGTTAERDRLSATLEEALTRCTSSLVAKQLAEDDCKMALQQLDAYRAQMVS